MDKKIAVLKGDGIGPEVIEQAVIILNKIAKKFRHHFKYDYFDIGGVSIDKCGKALSEQTLEAVKLCDAVLLGAVGGSKWDNGKVRPEQGLLALRKNLGVFANLRPAVLFEELREACPLKCSLVPNGFDVLIVRELTGGIYFGNSGLSTDGTEAFDEERYSVFEIKRLLEKAAEAARLRKKHVTVVDKANVLESSRLWRKVAAEVFRDFSDIKVDYMYVDNCAMQLVKNPAQFDVIATNNIFGDILSDELSMLTGSIGMLPSASLGNGKIGIYEPIHGSAPDIAEQDIANPIASILSAAMMLKYSFDMNDEYECINNAVKMFLQDGYRTKDLINSDEIQNSLKIIGTEQTGKIICDNL